MPRRSLLQRKSRIEPGHCLTFRAVISSGGEPVGFQSSLAEMAVNSASSRPAQKGFVPVKLPSSSKRMWMFLTVSWREGLPGNAVP